ncbi:SGNH/GDSL hydrolase family protein [Noviherbaspirillum sp.]|uniref:SGNH/GDSL hydrolase family protein n=1 Tax=Noviherbaspirillum sp. TaxID=1926288 RepID=UPI002D6D3F2B|nr:SGNH/GDSL hydrolase family protein [Noviherbaspirillum sp.]HZW21894.1 SGNH/GDSL hydrolase family protein [Noviherbaspirillum sp.]
MRHFDFAAALLSAAILAGCGGNNTPQFSSVVSFGDSLSDIGTYSVGTVRALGGGKYTVNDPASKNWIELMATKLNVAAPCPAQTGLQGDAAQGFSVPVTNFTNCTAYAQGGARVTNPVGPGNRALGGSAAILGQLTVPVVTQIQTHLNSRGGSFTGNEVVFVMAGGNDVFINLATVGAGGSPTAAVTAMGTAGAELGGYVKNLVVGKGAKYVVVVNLPDVSKTPFALSQSAETQGLINTMVTTFNSQLQQGLSGTDVLLVDAYTVSRDQNANPAKYGLTNVTAPACDLTPARNPLGSSLVCTRANLAAGATDTYQYADTVHPTPYGYRLLADLVTAQMGSRGWL